MIRGALCLASVTQYNVFKVHPHSSTPLHGQITLHPIESTIFCLSVHLADTYLCSFYFLAVMNNAATNIEAQVLVQTSISNSLEQTHRSEIAESCGHFIYLKKFFKLFLLLKNIFIDYAITVVPFPPFTQLHPAHPLPLKIFID